MTDLMIGQVLALKIRFNNDGTIAKTAHPYLVISINESLRYVEVAQIDSLFGKEYKAAKRSNKVIYADDPYETVIDKDSYVQLDNTLRLELFPGLIKYRRQTDTLSKAKLDSVLLAYHSYHRNHAIDDNKNVFMDEAEITSLNSR